MLRLIAQRIALSVPMVFLVSILTFVVLALSPVDVTYTILGMDAPLSSIAHLHEVLGLGHPLYVQYWNWLSAAVHGDFGTSYLTGQGVTAALIQRLPVTIALISGALVLSTTVGLGLGVLAAVRRGVSARVVDTISLLGMAFPTYWVALGLVAIFAVEWRIFPATGYVPFAQSPIDWARSLALPVVALSIGGIASTAKQTRDAMLDALSSDFVVALRARGISERSIVAKHALRHASIPIVTTVGLHFVHMLAGTVFVETVFALPGIGSLAVQATLQHDIPVVQGTAVFFGLIVVLVNFLVDLAYGWLNPKARIV